MNTKIRDTALILVAITLMGISVTGCKPSPQTAKKTKPASRVVVTAAEEIRMEEILLTTGEVRAMNTVTLQSTVEGLISFCPWREGDRVERAGQKLIEITRPLYQQELAASEAAVAVAQAKLNDLEAGARPEEITQARESVRHFADCTKFTKVDLDRIHKLVESDTLAAEMEERARVDYIKCHTQLNFAKENLAMLEAGATKTEIAVLRAAVLKEESLRDLAQAKLNECLMQAPFAGVVTEVFVRPGDLATPRQSLLKIIDESSLIIRTGLPESCATGIQKSTPAKVSLDAYPQQTFNAVVERIYPRIETSSRTRIVEFRITDQVKLMPRMFARVSVRGRVIEKAVRIPSKAIVATPRGDRVVFVVNQGKAVRRKVIIGLEQSADVQIVDGITAGDMVVIAGNLSLKDGAIVNAVPLQSESILKEESDQ